MFFLCQTIQTTWTKASRGGAGAQQRASVPDAFPVRLADPSGSNHLDHHLFREPFDRPRHYSESVDLPFRTGPLTIVRDATGIVITYQWDRDLVGAPARLKPGPGGMEIPIERTLRCEPGDWIRIQYNGRSSGRSGYFSEWSYLQVTANVAVFESAEGANGMVFCTSEPNAKIVDLMALW